MGISAEGKKKTIIIQDDEICSFMQLIPRTFNPANLAEVKKKKKKKKTRKQIPLFVLINNHAQFINLSIYIYV